MKPQTYNTLLDKIWRRFFIISFLIQLSMGLFIFVYGGQLMATRSGANMVSIAGIMNVIYQYNDPILMAQVQAEITKNDNYVIKSTPATINNETTSDPSLLVAYDNSYSNALPLYPAMLTFGKVVNTLCNNCFKTSYQNSPPMLWLQNKQPPYFSLGITLIAQRLFSLYIAVFMLVSILSAIGMAWWVSKNITQPLLKLGNHARLIIVNERETKDIHLEPDALLEVAVLADALNKMHADINHLIKDQELFLAEISHDLRTPLSRLNMAVQMQDVYITEHAGTMLEANLSKYVKGMQADIKEMSMIIDQTMEITHVNNALHETWLDADINELLRDIKAKYRRANIDLDLDLDTNLPTLRFKILTLTRLLYNLIDNALKYGMGEVYIVSAMDGLAPTVSVTNLIAAQDLDNETETLAPASPFESHLTAGSNKLGLEIVKRITEMHNITLDITQDAEVKTYQVTLRFN
jgi:signal transduction histidine kinase